jgi:hypothetical protein
MAFRDIFQVTSRTSFNVPITANHTTHFETVTQAKYVPVRNPRRARSSKKLENCLPCERCFSLPIHSLRQISKHIYHEIDNRMQKVRDNIKQQCSRRVDKWREKRVENAQRQKERKDKEEECQQDDKEYRAKLQREKADERDGAFCDSIMAMMRYSDNFRSLLDANTARDGELERQKSQAEQKVDADGRERVLKAESSLSSAS